LARRFKDIIKHEKTFLRLTTIRQGDKSVREFNQEFRTVLLDLDQRPKKETLVWYYKVVIRWEFAKSLGKVRSHDIEEAMQRVKDKKQEKTIYKSVYRRRIRS
jgi:hypothetical protein